MANQSYNWLAVAAFSAVFSGCGGLSSSLPTPVEIGGKVSFANGLPVTKATVAFFPAEGTVGQETFCIIDEQGRFQSRLSPGKYRVAVEPEWIRAATPAKSTLIPKRFWTFESSQLSVEVPTSGTKDLAINIS